MKNKVAKTAALKATVSLVYLGIAIKKAGFFMSSREAMPRPGFAAEARFGADPAAFPLPPIPSAYLPKKMGQRVYPLPLQLMSPHL